VTEAALHKNFEQLYQETNYAGVYGNKMKKGAIGNSELERENNIHFKWSRIIEFLLAQGFNDLDQLSFLDAGCGAGADIRKIIELGATPEKCYGIDFSETVLDYAREYSHKNTTFLKEDLTALSFEDHAFDIIFLFNVLQNYQDNKLVIEITNELKRILKPGGQILVVLPIGQKDSVSFGISNIPEHIYTLDSVQSLFPGMRLMKARYIGVDSITAYPQTVMAGMPGQQTQLDLNPIVQLADSMLSHQKYDFYYVKGALNHLLLGLDSIHSGGMILSFKSEC
jgi:ubiquinone/menaquinone biosynthesis C-methylase UbiE